MPTYEITIPGQGTFEISSDQELTDQQVYQYALGQVEADAPVPWGEVAAGAVKSFPSSLYGVGEDIATAVASPIDTVHNLIKVGAGALQNVLPEEFVQFVGEDKESRQMANAMGEYYSKRYGSMEGFKEALATDPAAIMADFASVLSGGSTIAAKMGVPAKMAAKVGKAAEFIDPIMLVGKGVKGAGKVGTIALTEALGKTTGAGAVPIEEAFKAGVAGGEKAKMFTEQMRGKAPIDDVLDIAKRDLLNMKIAKNQKYQESMAVLKTDAKVLGFDKIDDAIAKADEMITFKGEVKNQSAAQALQRVKETVNKWRDKDPSEFHTPEGMDALKQRVGEIIDDIPFENTRARTIANTALGGIKKQITSGAPTYSKMMGEYAEAAEQIKEIERALSLRDNAMADTGIRKLQSLMRNNASTNYGKRLDLAKELQEQGGGDFMAGLAGQALSEKTPRGIQGGTFAPVTGAAGYYGGIPGMFAAGAAQSPRLIGETAYATGRVAGSLSRPTQALLGMSPLSVQQALSLAYQAQQPKEERK